MNITIPTKTGRCSCGAVSWAYSGEETWACFCHCDDCRRNCAAPVVAFIGVPLSNFEWTGKTAKVWASSPGVERHFCDQCGTPMAFQADHYAGEIHLYAASLSNPAAFEPAFHVHYEERLPWLHIDDNLPKHPGFAP
ncbi:MAG: GFA family protein [Pikeienuella sp.]